MSTQERVDLRSRDGWSDAAAGRTSSNGAGGPATDRLPRPPGRRRPGLAVLGVLLVVLGAAVAGLLALRLDDRVPVLVARDRITVGQQITEDDLAVARMAAEGVAVIPADQAASVIGRFADQEIAPGRLVDAGMLATSGLLTRGDGAVGIALQPGRFPGEGLGVGDIVQVVRAVDGVGKVIAPRAVVSAVEEPSDSSFGAREDGATVVTVIVSEQVSPAVAAAAMADQISLVLVEGDQRSGGD